VTEGSNQASVNILIVLRTIKIAPFDHLREKRSGRYAAKLKWNIPLLWRGGRQAGVVISLHTAFAVHLSEILANEETSSQRISFANPAWIATPPSSARNDIRFLDVLT